MRVSARTYTRARTHTHTYTHRQELAVGQKELALEMKKGQKELALEMKDMRLCMKRIEEQHRGGSKCSEGACMHVTFSAGACHTRMEEQLRWLVLSAGACLSCSLQVHGAHAWRSSCSGSCSVQVHAARAWRSTCGGHVQCRCMHVKFS